MQELQIIDWDSIEVEAVSQGIRRQVVTGEKMTVARMRLDDGLIVPLHAHENEQITQVIQGTMRFSFGEDRSVHRDVGPGGVVVIPSNLHHEAVMIGEVVEIDMWAPRRADWLNGSDNYLRGGAAGQLSGTVEDE